MQEARTRVVARIAAVILTVVVSVLLVGGCSWLVPGPTPEEIDPEPIIPITTKLIEDKDAVDIVEYSADGVLTLKEGAALTQNIVPGDTIVSAPTTATPDGLLRKVESVVVRADGTAEVRTSHATLEDAIHTAVIRSSGPLSPSSATHAIHAAGVQPMGSTELGSFKYELDHVVLYDRDGDKKTQNDQIYLNGALELRLEYEFLCDISWRKVKRVLFKAIATEAAHLELTGVLSLSSEGEVEIGRLRLGTIVIPASLVPVVIIPVVVLNAGYEASLDAGLVTSVEQGLTCESGVQYSNGSWSPISSFEISFDYSPPQLTASASCRAYVKPELQLMVYGVAGPHVNIEGYVELLADPFVDPWWELYAGLSARAGVKFEILGKGITYESPDLIGIRELLASAPSGQGAHGVPAPDEVKGPSEALIGEQLRFWCRPVSCSREEHSVEYQFVWGDGEVSSFGAPSRTHTYAEAGTYPVSIIARCEEDITVVSDPSPELPVVIETPPEDLIPHTVPVPSPPEVRMGVVKEGVPVRVYATDSDLTCSRGHPVEYSFSWGDGTADSNFSEETSRLHTYTSTGEFAITVRARCADAIDIVSDPSERTSVDVIPDTYIEPITPEPDPGLTGTLVRIRVWDAGSDDDDVFALEVMGENLGLTPAGGQRIFQTRIASGTYASMKIRTHSAPDGFGTYGIEILSGATTNTGATRIEGDHNSVGEVSTFVIIVQ